MLRWSLKGNGGVKRTDGLQAPVSARVTDHKSQITCIPDVTESCVSHVRVMGGLAQAWYRTSFRRRRGPECGSASPSSRCRDLST